MRPDTAGASWFNFFSDTQINIKSQHRFGTFARLTRQDTEPTLQKSQISHSPHSKFSAAKACLLPIIRLGLHKTKTTIDRNFHIEKLKQAFITTDVFTTSDIVHFYKKIDPAILKSTVNWRVYELVNRSILERIGKGKFRLGAGTTFIPDLNTKHFKVSTSIKTKFPFTSYCIWDSAFIKEFSQHISKSNFMLVDAERGSEESIYQLLKEQFKEVFLTPGKEMLSNYFSDLKKPVIVRTLVSEAPYKEVRNVPVATLEKILVDIFSDIEFEYLRSNEMVLIYKSAFERYTISESKLIRYADRKRKKKQLVEFLNYNKIKETN
jgi:hypothetical protein